MTERPTAEPRVLFVGRARYRLPLPAWLAKKWDAVEEELDYRVIGAASRRQRAERRPLPVVAAGAAAPARRPPLLSPLAAAAAAPDPAASGQTRSSRPILLGAAALAGRLLARRRVPVIVEVHGDWRTFSRLYGSPARRLIGPLADAVGTYAVRRADATRAVSTFTADLVEQARGVPPSAVFTAFSDLSAFAEREPVPLPERPTAAFVGALEAYKNVEGLAAAWRRVAEQLPAARPRDRRQRLAAGAWSTRSWRTSRPRRAPRVARARSRLRAARRVDGARAAILPGGSRPRDHRGVCQGPRGGGDRRGRHPRSRHARGRRAARAAGGLGGARRRPRASARRQRARCADGDGGEGALRRLAFDSRTARRRPPGAR